MEPRCRVQYFHPPTLVYFPYCCRFLPTRKFPATVQSHFNSREKTFKRTPHLLVNWNADSKYVFDDDNTVSSQGLPEAGEERGREETLNQTSHKSQLWLVLNIWKKNQLNKVAIKSVVLFSLYSLRTLFLKIHTTVILQLHEQTKFDWLLLLEKNVVIWGARRPLCSPFPLFRKLSLSTPPPPPPPPPPTSIFFSQKLFFF